MQNTLETQTATAAGSNDYHLLPATEKQLRFAKTISARTGVVLPYEATLDRSALSVWIDTNKTAPGRSDLDAIPTAKQVAFAENIARRKHRDVPRECFRDKRLMSAWITGNK